MSAAPKSSTPKIVKQGGARPGAGRPPKAETHQTPVKDAEKRIADRLPELIEKLFTLANGVVVEEIDKDGGSEVYAKPPDIKALVYLVDRVMGKATQPIAGDDSGAPLRIQVEYADPEPREE